MHRNSIQTSLLALALFFSLAAQAENEPDVPWEKLRNTAKSYLDACIPAKDVDKLAKKFRQQVQQRLSDSDVLGEDSVMRSIMLDWAASNQSKLKRKERSVVMEACFYFVTFYDKGFVVPQQIRASLTPDAVKEIFEYLDGEIAKAKK